MEEPLEATAHTNIDLAYQYTESVLKDVNRSFDVITSKLTTALAFSGVLLRFAADLSDKGWCLIITKVAICILLSVAIISCALGLLPQKTGDVVPPDDLLEKGEWYYNSNELCKLYIARAWNTAIKQIDKVLEYRKACFNWTMQSLAMAALLFAVSIALSSIYENVENFSK